MQPLRKLVLLASILALIGATMPVASAGPASCENRNNNTISKLLECVDIEGVRQHQAELQAIADANGGTRVSGTSDYDASVDYVVDRMEAAGYEVTVQDFDFQTFIVLGPTILEQVAPEPAGPVESNIMSYSGSGDVTASVSTVPNLGCDPADFAGFPAGDMALISRGACAFGLKGPTPPTQGQSG